MKKIIKKTVLSLSITLLSSISFAESKNMSYDVSGAVGSYYGEPYTQLTLGLNWYLSEHMNWRNSVFTQFGSKLNTTYGLDSAALFGTEFYNSGHTAGLEIFAGPGVRVASENSSAATATAGLTVQLAGIRIGGGATYLNYFETRHNTDDVALPKDETQYFITISGGGSF
jgi:hypothetical protein